MMIRRASVTQQTTAQLDGAISAKSGRDCLTETRRSGRLAAPADDSLAFRKLSLLKRSGLFGDDTKGCTIGRACTLDDLRQAYRLVHDVYLETGFIHREPSGMRLRMFETTSETATFVAKKDGRVVGVLSVVLDSPDLGLPSDSVFKPELDQLRREGARLAEVTNQAVADGYRKSAVPTELMRCAIALLLKAGYHEAVATVSPSHNGFYDLLGFRQVGSERSYSDKLDDPVIALSMDINQYRAPRATMSATEQFMRDFLTETNQFMGRIGDWTREARRHFLNAELLHQLFVAEGMFLPACSPEQLRILYRRWGHEMFEAVAGELLRAAIVPSWSELPWTVVETRPNAAPAPAPTRAKPPVTLRTVRRRRMRRLAAAYGRALAAVATAAHEGVRPVVDLLVRLEAGVRLIHRSGHDTAREWAVSRPA